ncbi:hypothetical protein OG301_36125 [Streptomyces platensis]|uniref:hypothetical protein n=1 Tax=Streptomyces platensis TaxID=58346 RepID=UPI002E0D8CC5|nr:hypothetical protein OG229_03115 [Streptomyces platensis]WTI56327.1 hypothetical protein OG301_36125 [Streptomyces platensis]
MLSVLTSPQARGGMRVKQITSARAEKTRTPGSATEIRSDRLCSRAEDHNRIAAGIRQSR